MTFITAEMRPANLGRFLISCQIHAHRHGKKLYRTSPRFPDFDFLSSVRSRKTLSGLAVDHSVTGGLLGSLIPA